MEGKQGVSSQVGEHSLEWIKNLEKTGVAVAESLSQIVNTVETVVQSVSKFFNTLKQQKDSVVELGHSASAKIRPVAQSGMKVLSSSREMGSRLITKSRQNPTPFIIGGIAIVGGIALLAYYLREEEKSGMVDERDIFAA